MITVIGLSGSLRRGSFNTAVLRAAGSLMPSDSELRIESRVPLAGVLMIAPKGVTRLRSGIWLSLR